jgi:hypothetical protein
MELIYYLEIHKTYRKVYWKYVFHICLQLSFESFLVVVHKGLRANYTRYVCRNTWRSSYKVSVSFVLFLNKIEEHRQSFLKVPSVISFQQSVRDGEITRSIFTTSVANSWKTRYACVFGLLLYHRQNSLESTVQKLLQPEE